jgi:DNA-binding transcriptional LysR family regulator
MDLDDLRIFRTVMQEGGITAAALRLHRVQSNVTTRIRQLEERLGTALFLRENRRLQPTPAAHVLAGYAERLLDLAEAARNAVSDGVPRGRLRLGAMESTAATRLPAVLANLHRAYPALAMELRTGPSAQLQTLVANGELDCALIAAPASDPRLQATGVFEEELILVTPADQPPVVSAADLRHRTLLAFAAGCTYRSTLERWLAEGGILIERVIELASYHAIIGCAAAGMGIAFIPARLLAQLPAADSVGQHRLPPEVARITTLLIHRQERQDPAIGALKAALAESADGESEVYGAGCAGR